MGPIDLSNCIFRNTEATDSIEDVVRAVGNLGTSEESTLRKKGHDVARITDGKHIWFYKRHMPENKFPAQKWWILKKCSHEIRFAREL